ncbi:DNA glycosylase [Stipitochalara longipes BDJ]|nr:DNA glycosylase [Stipitochalara longipes BDJ]
MEEELKEEDVNLLPNSEPIVPSFKGRLNLSSYTFSPKLDPKAQNAAVRRSPRVVKSEPDVEAPIPRTIKPGSRTSSPISKTKRKSSNLSPSPSPRKKSRSPSGYAPPSTYAHLPELQDVLAQNLICVFIGLNPGITTATSGHAYAHPSNLFWKLLHSSGCTDRRLHPSEDGTLPEKFELGNTNIVSRPTRNGSELSKGEMDASVQVLEEKIESCRPEAVCVVGKSIWESIWRTRRGRAIRKEEFRYGWQDEGERMGKSGEWEGAKVFVACSTSGLAATLSVAEKERIWRELGVWVEKRRKERGSFKIEEES